MLFSLLVACETTSVLYAPTCDLTQPVLSVSEATPGSSVVLNTSPLTTKNDTLVTVGAATAAITALDRTECDACDTCIVASGLTECDDADDCAADCSTCVESVTIEVPAVAAGEHPVIVRNIHGQSPAAALTVTAGDTGD